jgi:hypothetical protein
VVEKKNFKPKRNKSARSSVKKVKKPKSDVYMNIVEPNSTNKKIPTKKEVITKYFTPSQAANYENIKNDLVIILKEKDFLSNHINESQIELEQVRSLTNQLNIIDLER